MINKKIIILAIFLVSLLTVSVVSATENTTCDIVGTDNTTDCNVLCDDLESESNLEINNIEDNQDTVGNYDFQDEISLDDNNSNDDKVRSNANTVVESETDGSSSNFSVKVYTSTINQASDGIISMKISSMSNLTNSYVFYLKVFDSNNNERISLICSGPIDDYVHDFPIGANHLSSGNYILKIINYDNNAVLSTTTLTVKPSTFPSYSDYSVNISNTIIDYGSNRTFSMRISPASGYTYTHFYTLQIYDSKNNLKISKVYYSTADDNFHNYLFSTKQLDQGTYTVKIINYIDGGVINTTTLTVKYSSPSYSDYSVSISNTTIDYGFNGSISMEIMPTSNFTYRYNYYLKIYDSNNKEISYRQYLSTDFSYLETYNIIANKLKVGTYTIKIINFADNKVMSTATLKIKSTTYPSSSDYSVSVFNTTIYDGPLINMTISPASNKYTNRYAYYLNVYDSDNNVKISQFYRGTTDDYSKRYIVGESQLSPGNYTIKIINYEDKEVMSTATLKVEPANYPSASDYSVSVYSPTIKEGSSGVITMNITPSFNSIYKYCYYLKICNLTNTVMISELYYSTIDDYSKTYTIPANQLGLGIYNAKIINYIDNKTMDTMQFRVISPEYPSYLDYSVRVSNITINDTSSASIKMRVTPSSSSNYTYFYTLQVYDSNNNQIVYQLYYGKDKINSKTYTIDKVKLSHGTYTIKLYNYADGKLMDTATLTVKSAVCPYSSDYSVNVSDTNLEYLSSGYIRMSIVPASNLTYKYYYYLKVYDSNNTEVISEFYSGKDDAHYKSYYISENQLSLGTYAIKIVNYIDKSILDTATLTIKNSTPIYPSASDYSVSLSDLTMNYSSRGVINMNIAPANCIYKYYYYLKVYDSNNNENISKLYYGTSNATSKTYTMTENQLSPGTYTIKIINYADNKVMSTATLTVKSDRPSASDYSVIISDCIINESSKSIKMNISPSLNSIYKYYYYLKVYDSSNNEIISELYYGTGNAYSKTYTLNEKQLSKGIYTIKIINYEDNEVMSTATLKVDYTTYPFSSDYSVSVSNSTIDYGYRGYIKMNITSASDCKYPYYYYLKVYDSNNNENISKLYYGTSNATSKTYTMTENQLSPGTYTIKIINYADNKVMSTATLRIGYFPYPSASDYSVNIYNSSIHYGVTGSINMYIYASSSFTYKYAYYLKVYDSNNYEKISELYSNTTSAYSKAYNINSKELSPGTYTIKIINYADNEVMNSATLIVNPSEYPYSSDYSVNVSDLSIDYGSSGIISMNIAPASSSIYKYYYYLKVYDSNNNEKVSERYYSNSTDYLKTYSINSNQLNPGTYIVKIINYADNNVMSIATLTVKSPSTIPTNPDNPEIISKEPTNVFAKSNTAIYGNNLDFVLDNYKSGLVVSVKINGITKNYVTSNGGHIYIPTTGFGAGTYSVTITFNGDSLYEKSTSVLKVTIKKATPKITAKAKTFKKSVKTKKYSITLKDNKGKAMKNTKVTIKVNKKTYSAKTNSKGVATFKITKLTKKGNFASVITYKGNNYYNKVTKKVKIKIK